MLKRNIEKFSLRVLREFNKILFISGPRQSGKTTFAQMLLQNYFQGTYLNWDIINHQKIIAKNPYFFEEENRDLKKDFLVIFDEIHKYNNWKNYLKGCYDGYKNEFKFIVTGSGRLDIFKKGGDSLFGRYFAVNLFPFSLGEIVNIRFTSWNDFYNTLKEGFENKSCYETFDQLFNLSGFPEPFLKSSKTFYNIWHNERKKTIIREDIRNVYFIKDISNMEILSALLPDRIGSPLSMNSLREDIKASFDSIKKWLLILEQFYYFFKIKPYSKNLARTIKKENKIYLYDWVEIEDDSVKFENLIAFHLFKAVNLWTQMGEGNFDLFFVRDKEKREVDFLITKDNKPLFMVEAKFNDETISKNLLLFQSKLSIPFAIQVVNKRNVLKRMKKNNLIQYVISADNFLSNLP